MSTQSLGDCLKQDAVKKGLSNRYIADYLNIHVTTVSKHFNNNLKISDSDLTQYCKLLKLSYEFLQENYRQIEHYVCGKETNKKILAGLAAVGVGVIAYNIVKNKLDENCSNRYLAI